ncbi:DNA cytosine methyltransferase [Serratia nevei]|uniref:DNA cytosine methyltransferase n=1 Tax=Serratia nevei TaxID=2703794 RepID=UPI003FA73B24
MNELIVDNFAGGGGASTGIEMATGRSVNIAINHDENAIAMHETNHPETLHYCESVFDIDPVAATCGHPVALAWFSPDCRHFSKAKGAAPVKKEIRGLAWIVVRWALKKQPRLIPLENVEEHELYAAQGFPEWYIIDQDYKGKKYAKDKQVARCGNAVPPPFAEALVRANLPELCVERKEVAA